VAGESSDSGVKRSRSLASNFHGIPRSTRDADFVIELEPGKLQRLGEALPSDLKLQPQGSFEGVTGTTRYIVELVNLRRWATEHGTLALLDEIGKSIPPT
jgi:hypothetical protein